MSVLKVHVSYQCSAQCDHCHLRAGQFNSPAIDFEIARNTISKLNEHNNLEKVILLGGEPGLFPDLTHKILEYAFSLGCQTRIETNASWAHDKESAFKFLNPLVQIGCEIMLSVDSFHEKFIKIENNELTIRVLDELKGKYTIEVPYLISKDSDNGIDKRTNQIISELEVRLGRKPFAANMYIGNVFFKGRAAHKLSELVSKGRGVPKDKCDTVPWWDNGSQQTLDLLSLDPFGNITKECGISIGNVYKNEILDIIYNYKSEKHPIISVLIEKGPLGLAEEACKMGYTLKENYADKCHLCQEVREVLRTKYPEYLTPEHHYSEMG
jgi:pyruvate-formate lyase-activating enzyme